MPQEFLASFAVDIDEGGVNRLQAVLSRNRELAESLASAFSSARSSMAEFIRSASEELPSLPFFSRAGGMEEAPGSPGSFAVGLDFSRASKQLDSFLDAAKKQMKLTADGSGIVSAASAALARVRSMFSGANLVLKVKTETETVPGSTGFTGNGCGSSAVPLSGDRGNRSVYPSLSALSGVPALFAGVSAAAAPVVQQSTSHNVQAPVNIHVEAAAADPEAVGRSIYDTAERYLMRTLRTVG